MLFVNGGFRLLLVVVVIAVALGTRPAEAAEDMAKVKTPLLINYAGTDERINAMWPAYEAALKANKTPYEVFFYEGTQHGFHNNSTPRYSEAQAKLSWDRTIAFWKKHLV